jgi:Sugar (and other) transporter.
MIAYRIRGRIVSLQQCCINLGILVAFWIQYGTSFLSGNASWRLALGLQMIPTVSLHVTMWFMPESPRWLAQRDEYDKATKGTGSGAFEWRYQRSIRSGRDG